MCFNSAVKEDYKDTAGSLLTSNKARWFCKPHFQNPKLENLPLAQHVAASYTASDQKSLQHLLCMLTFWSHCTLLSSSIHRQNTCWAHWTEPGSRTWTVLGASEEAEDGPPLSWGATNVSWQRATGDHTGHKHHCSPSTTQLEENYYYHAEKKCFI